MPRINLIATAFLLLGLAACVPAGGPPPMSSGTNCLGTTSCGPILVPIDIQPVARVHAPQVIRDCGGTCIQPAPIMAPPPPRIVYRAPPRPQRQVMRQAPPPCCVPVAPPPCCIPVGSSAGTTAIGARATDDGTRILGREALNTKKKHRCTKDIGGKNVTGWCVD